MTTREQIIAAASNVGAYRYVNRAAKDEPTHTFTIEQLERFYTIAFEAGRVAEREECLTALGKVMVTDHSLRTYNRCLEAIHERNTK